MQYILNTSFPTRSHFKVWIWILNIKEWFSLFVLWCNPYCDSEFKDLVQVAGQSHFIKLSYNLALTEIWVPSINLLHCLCFIMKFFWAIFLHSTECILWTQYSREVSSDSKTLWKLIYKQILKAITWRNEVFLRRKWRSKVQKPYKLSELPGQNNYLYPWKTKSFPGNLLPPLHVHLVPLGHRQCFFQKMFKLKGRI